MIAAGIILLMMPAMMTALDNFRLTDQSDSYVVASGNASPVVTLSQKLYNNATANVKSISSNYSGDAPIASSYASTSRALTITGLNTSVGHYLTVTYSIDGMTDFFGGQTAARVIPILLLLGVVCIIGGASYGAWTKIRE